MNAIVSSMPKTVGAQQERLFITVPEGIMGFPHTKRFVILEEAVEDPLFRWLQSIDDPEVGFLVIDPTRLVPDYREKIPLRDIAESDLLAPEMVIVLVIVTVRQGDPNTMTANLLGPLVLNPYTRMARQVVLSNTDYSACQPVVDAVAVCS